MCGVQVRNLEVDCNGEVEFWEIGVAVILISEVAER
jgi:hypothetical protein